MSLGENPYIAQTDPPLPGYGSMPAPALDYTGAYGYIFQSAAWVPNVFFTLLATLIPVIGQIIVLGYQFEIVEALIRDPRRVYPDFDWGKFSQYLTRGVWPFLISLIVAIVVTPILLIGMFGAIFLIGILMGGDNDLASIMGVAAIIGFSVFCFFGVLLLQTVISTFQLRAGLSQDFGASFNLTWVRDYIGRMWIELLLSMLFLMLTGIPLALGGMLFFFIGVYVVAAGLMLVQAHFYFQLYRIYLARGGMEIPLKPIPPAMPGIPR